MSAFDEFEQARQGILPDGFTHWKIALPSGWTVAHEAARFGTLPADFDQWEMATADGWTVAHEAAANDHLPPDFKSWDLGSAWGLSVGDIDEMKRKFRAEMSQTGTEWPDPLEKPKSTIRM